MVLMHINSSFPWRLHIYIYIYMWFVLFPTKNTSLPSKMNNLNWFECQSVNLKNGARRTGCRQALGVHNWGHQGTHWIPINSLRKICKHNMQRQNWTLVDECMRYRSIFMHSWDVQPGTRFWPIYNPLGVATFWAWQCHTICIHIYTICRSTMWIGLTVKAVQSKHSTVFLQVTSPFFLQGCTWHSQWCPPLTSKFSHGKPPKRGPWLTRAKPYLGALCAGHSIWAWNWGMRYLMGILTAKMVISHNIFWDTVFGQTHLVCILALLTFLMLLVYVCVLYFCIWNCHADQSTFMSWNR